MTVGIATKGVARTLTTDSNSIQRRRCKISFGRAEGKHAEDDINSFEEKTVVCPICKTKFRCTRDNLEKTQVPRD